jgi:hypothetical protein
MSAAAAGGLHTTLLIAARQSQSERQGNLPHQKAETLVDAAYSRMEEGSHVPTPQNQDTSMSDYWKWKFPNIFFMVL